MHRRVRATLAEGIASGRYAAGQMLPSEQTLCRQFNVSRITIRQALADLAHEGVLVKQPGRGTFITGNLRKTAPTGRDITLLLTNTAGSFMAQIIRGAERTARERGYNLSVAIAYDDANQERSCIELALERRVAGMLVFPIDTREPANPNCFDYLRIERAGIPLLFLDRYLAALPIGYVVGANREGMRALTGHLIEQGHRQIGYIHHGISASSVVERQAGYLDALQKHGLQPGPQITVDQPRGGGMDVELGEAAVAAHLSSQGRPPRALVACNTYYAIGAFRACKQAGLRVPEDVALAGFDDVPEASVLEVPLTVWRIAIEQMGAVAAGKLMDVIEGTENGADVRVRLPGELVVRVSCGASPPVTARVSR